LGERVRALREADVVQKLVRTLLDRLLLGARLRVPQDCAEHVAVRAHVAADHHVLERGQVGEQADVLERPRDPLSATSFGLRSLSGRPSNVNSPASAE
jgi:hypothetical protein